MVLSVGKFVILSVMIPSHGLGLSIDTQGESAASAIDKVANAVTHTRFVGTNPNDDEVVLMRILQVE